MLLLYWTVCLYMLLMRDMLVMFLVFQLLRFIKIPSPVKIYRSQINIHEQIDNY